MRGYIELCGYAFGPTGYLDEEEQQEAQKLFNANILPYILKRLDEGEYHATRKDKEGWTALTLLVSSCNLTDRQAFPFRLAERLLQLGAEVDEKSPDEGGTPLIIEAWAEKIDDQDAAEKLKSALSGLQLLLVYGADVNAQGNDADTFLHNLVRKRNLPLLRRLYSESQNHMMAVDYTIKNNKQETAVQMADRLHREEERDEEKQNVKEIFLLLHNQSGLWQTRVLPFIRSTLDCHFISDLSTIVLTYMFTDAC